MWASSLRCGCTALFHDDIQGAVERVEPTPGLSHLAPGRPVAVSSRETVPCLLADLQPLFLAEIGHMWRRDFGKKRLSIMFSLRAGPWIIQRQSLLRLITLTASHTGVARSGWCFAAWGSPKPSMVWLLGGGVVLRMTAQIGALRGRPPAPADSSLIDTTITSGARWAINLCLLENCWVVYVAQTQPFRGDRSGRFAGPTRSNNGQFRSGVRDEGSCSPEPALR